MIAVNGECCEPVTATSYFKRAYHLYLTSAFQIQRFQTLILISQKNTGKLIFLNLTTSTQNIVGSGQSTDQTME